MASLCNPPIIHDIQGLNHATDTGGDIHIQDNLLLQDSYSLGGGGRDQPCPTTGGGGNIPSFGGAYPIHESNNITFANMYNDYLLHDPLSAGYVSLDNGLLYGGGGGDQPYPATCNGGSFTYAGNQPYPASNTTGGSISYCGDGGGNQPYPATGGSVSYYGGDGGNQPYPATDATGVSISYYGGDGGNQLYRATDGSISYCGGSGGNQPYPATDATGDSVSYYGGDGGNQPCPATDTTGGNISYYGGDGGNQPFPATNTTGGSISYYGGNGGYQPYTATDTTGGSVSYYGGNQLYTTTDTTGGSVSYYGGNGGYQLYTATDSGGNIPSNGCGVQLVEGAQPYPTTNNGGNIHSYGGGGGNQPYPVTVIGANVPSNGGGDEVVAAYPAIYESGGGDEVAAILANMYKEYYLHQHQLHLPTDEEVSEARIPVMPLGFRFLPSEDELITQFLIPEFYDFSSSTTSSTTTAAGEGMMIRHANIYNYHPSQLQELANYYHYCDGKMYFFTWIKIGKSRTDRRIISEQGFWKATQKARPIQDQFENIIGSKTPLTYIHNTAKTPWLMSEYKLPQDSSCHLPEELVLAVIYKLHRRRDDDDDTTTTDTLD